MLRENKSFQFIVGCFVLFLGWKLYTLGVLDWFFANPEEDGVQSVALIPMLLSAIVSAVQMVGLVAILLVGGLAPQAEKLVDYARSKMPKLDKVAQKVEDNIDADKLTDVLNKLDERIRLIEIKFPDSTEDKK